MPVIDLSGPDVSELARMLLREIDGAYDVRVAALESTYPAIRRLDAFDDDSFDLVLMFTWNTDPLTYVDAQAMTDRPILTVNPAEHAALRLSLIHI